MINWTIQELYNSLREEIAKGNGNKKILLSNDDEGNGYHVMYDGVFNIPKGYLSLIDLPYGVNRETINKDYVIIS